MFFTGRVKLEIDRVPHFSYSANIILVIILQIWQPLWFLDTVFNVHLNVRGIGSDSDLADTGS